MRVKLFGAYGALALFLLALLSVIPLALRSSHAADVRVAFKHHHWQVLSTKEKQKKLCYVFGAPISSTGNFKKRGEPYIFVTAVGDNRYEFSTSSGYPYKEKEGSVEITAEQRRFKTVTKENTAWMLSDEDDNAIIKAMMKHNIMHVVGKSRVNTTSDDRYSLKGFNAAFEWMKKHCK